MAISSGPPSTPPATPAAPTDPFAAFGVQAGPVPSPDTSPFNTGATLNLFSPPPVDATNPTLGAPKDPLAPSGPSNPVQGYGAAVGGTGPAGIGGGPASPTGITGNGMFRRVRAGGGGPGSSGITSAQPT